MEQGEEEEGEEQRSLAMVSRGDKRLLQEEKIDKPKRSRSYLKCDVG